jgi:streptogramin lyase
MGRVLLLVLALAAGGCHPRSSSTKVSLSPTEASSSSGASASPSHDGVVAPRNSLVLVNARTDSIVAQIPLGATPARVSYGEGAFWVVCPDAGRIVRVNPRTSAIRRVELGEEPFDAAIGAGALWVPDHDTFRIYRLDLKSGEVSKSKSLGNPQLAVAYGFGAVWAVGADDGVSRLDPRTLSVTGTIPGVADSAEGAEPKMTVARDGLWISDAITHTFTRVDPKRLRVTHRAGHGGDGMTAGGGGVWSADGGTSVWRFARGHLRPVRAGSGPIDVAASDRAVWAVSRFDETLLRIDPRRLHVVSVTPLGGEPIALAVGDGYVAVIVD